MQARQNSKQIDIARKITKKQGIAKREGEGTFLTGLGMASES